MRIERKVGELGETTDIVHLNNGEGELLDRAHDIVKDRFLREGLTYDKSDRERVEYWLLGILIYDGPEKVLDMAKNSPIARPKKHISVGYAGTKEEPKYEKA